MDVAACRDYRVNFGGFSSYETVFHKSTQASTKFTVIWVNSSATSNRATFNWIICHSEYSDTFNAHIKTMLDYLKYADMQSEITLRQCANPHAQ